MKRNVILGGLPVVMLVCSLLPAAAHAQFAQQGPKLVGTDIIGNFAGQGTSVALSGDGNTAIAGGPFVGVGAAWVYTRWAGCGASRGLNWLVRVR